MNSVFPRSMACSIALDLRGVGAVEHVKPGPTRLPPKSGGKDFRAQARAAHTEQDNVSEAALLHLAGKALKAVDIGQLFLDDPQPADPFVFVRSGPQGFVPGPQAPDVATFAPGLHFVVERRLQITRAKLNDEAGAGTLGKRTAAPGNGAEQLVESVGELLHAVADQLFRDFLQRDAVPFQFGKDRAGAVDVLLDGVGHGLTVIAECVHGCRRYCIDGVATDQRLDIQCVLVARIFGAGGGPEQPLRLGAGRRQFLPAFAGKQFLVAGVGLLRVSDRDLAA